MGATAGSAGGRSFFSLKWKALIVLSLVLVLVNASIAYLVYSKAVARFEAEQAGKRSTQTREFNAVMAKGFESVSTFAPFIPLLSTSTSARRSVLEPANILEVLAAHGLMLDVEWGVEGVHYFAADQPRHPSVSWPKGRTVPAVQDLLRLAGRVESPQGRLTCDLRCMFLIAVPVLHHGVTAAFLVVERSIGDSLKEFHLLSGAEVLLLQDPARTTGARGNEPRLWDQAVAGVTHGESVMPVLQSLALDARLDEIRDRPHRIEFASAWYEVFALPVSAVDMRVTVLALNEVTAQVLAIREATVDSLLLGFAGLLLSELILLLLMSGPMQRIQDVVYALPLLAEKSYSRLRHELPVFSRDGLPRDEIDVMIEAIATVADRIEALDTAHAAAGRALRDSEQNLQLAQSMARVVSWSGRPADGAFGFDPAAGHIHRVLAHVSTWIEFLAFVHPEDKLALLKAWRNGRSGAGMDIEFRLLIGEQQIDIHAMAEFEAVGPEGDLRAVGMMQDISEMRAIQRALREHRDRLEQEVLERTAELVDARNVAERLAQTKGQFLANMSHEIRTPLNAIMGLSQIGMQQTQNRRVSATFEQILDAGEHLLHVINDVLDLSKLEAGKLAIEARPFDLRKALRQCTGMLKQRVEAKGLALSVAVAADVPQRLVGDGFRLQQILINLLSNAVKFTECGAVAVDVYRQSDDYYFKVTDSGIGMSADQIGRLFIPFQQGRDTTVDKREGTGLGLSISNTLAIMMGGAIQVRSEPGSGSEFLLRLPLNTWHESRFERPDQAGPTLAGGSRLAGLRVLVADDVAMNRSVVEALLLAQGAEVTTVNNGEEAVDAVLGGGGRVFDVVLMDVQMPRLDGRQATRLIREAGAQLPIIGLTAHVSPEEHRASLAAGMHDQLVKPIMPNVLVAMILSHTAGSPFGPAGTGSLH